MIWKKRKKLSASPETWQMELDGYLVEVPGRLLSQEMIFFEQRPSKDDHTSLDGTCD